MPRTRHPYSPEFRRQMFDLVRAGRSPDDLAKEFEPTAQSIGAWVAPTAKQDGRQKEHVTAPGKQRNQVPLRLKPYGEAIFDMSPPIKT